MDTLQRGAAGMGILLTAGQLSLFETYYRELMSWNEKFNLTAITGRESVQINHFLDSLTIATVLDNHASSRVLDVGTGGGMPGIPLKIAVPELEITLLEATGKKTVFLRHILEVLGLENIRIVTGRAEEFAQLPEYREQYEYVLARAVAALNTLVELTLPFCAIGGFVIAPKKGNIQDEITAAQPAIDKLGGKLRDIRPVTIPDDDGDRRLIIIEKVRKTPEMYPRRPGMPSKRPLN